MCLLGIFSAHLFWFCLVFWRLSSYHPMLSLSSDAVFFCQLPTFIALPSIYHLCSDSFFTVPPFQRWIFASLSVSSIHPSIRLSIHLVVCFFFYSPSFSFFLSPRIQRFLRSDSDGSDESLRSCALRASTRHRPDNGHVWDPSHEAVSTPTLRDDPNPTQESSDLLSQPLLGTFLSSILLPSTPTARAEDEKDAFLLLANPDHSREFGIHGS